MVCSRLALFSWLFGWNETRAHVVDFSEVGADVQNLDFFMGLGLQNSRRESFTVSSCYGVDEFIFYSSLLGYSLEWTPGQLLCNYILVEYNMLVSSHKERQKRLLLVSNN